MCSKTFTLQPKTVWTQGDTATTLAHGMTGPLSSAEVHMVRASFRLLRSSGAISVRAALQFSSDSEVWDAAEEFGPAFRSTEGESVGTSFVDATALGTRKLYVRLIIVAKNASGTEVEYGDVTARFDLED